MTGVGPGFIRQPGGVAAGLVGLAVRILPADQRDRYEAEFRADLCSISRRRQVPQAAGLLVGAYSLRRVLKETDMEIMKSVKYWKCRLRRHRYVVVSDANPENRRSFHLECSRCLKLKELKEYEASNGKWLAGGTGF